MFFATSRVFFRAIFIDNGTPFVVGRARKDARERDG